MFFANVQSENNIATGTAYKCAKTELINSNKQEKTYDMHDNLLLTSTYVWPAVV